MALDVLSWKDLMVNVEIEKSKAVEPRVSKKSDNGNGETCLRLPLDFP